MANRLFKMALFSLLGISCMMSASYSQAVEYTSKNPLILKLESVYMPAHPVIKNGLAIWAEELKKQSEGRLVVEIYNPNTICSEADIFNSTRDGILDIGVGVMQRIKGMFPLSNVHDLPFMYPTVEISGKVINQMEEEFPQLREEYKGVKILSNWGSCPIHIMTKNKPVQDLADLKGRKIGSVSSAATVAVIQALGGTAVNIPFVDFYMAVQRGQVDSLAIPYPMLVSSKVYEVVRYASEMNLLVNGMYMVMNNDVLQDMPEDLRNLLLASVGTKLESRISAAIAKGAEDDLATSMAKGLKVNKLSSEVIQKAREATAHVVEDWVASCEKARKGNGELARSIYKRAVELSAKYSAEAGIEWSF